MRRRSAGAWLLAALLIFGPLSCSRSNNPGIKKKDQTDPLLLSKTPVQAKYGMTTDLHPRPDPAPPTMPAGAWVSQPGAPHLGSPEPAPPAPFRWTSDRKDLPEPKQGEKPSDLQGILEKEGDTWLLRTDAVAGGKVVLEGHPRVDMLNAGDVIRVEGRLVDESAPRAGGAWLPYPTFQIKHLRLIQRKS
jgi:hypothetical protein